MTEVYLALGSNVGDSREYIAQAVGSLSEVVKNLKQAPLYKSKPVGYTEQADFINTAVNGHTTLHPEVLLARLKAIEQELGRTESFRWGPREIDIDIIFYGDTILETPKLTIPHESFRDRAFVLKPLVDLNPGFVDPFSQLSVSLLLKALPAEEIAAVRPVDD
jgi:2-amino-4-hydroxy-6-hydroxymethyldihydropteridine diphosphokinase